MKKKIKDLEKYVLTFLMIITFFMIVFATKVLAYEWINSPINAKNIQDEDFEILVLTEFKDDSAKEMSLEELESEINYCKAIKQNAHELAEYARNLGWSENCNTIKNARAEHHNATLSENFYKEIYNEKKDSLKNAKWIEKEKEFPEATYIWHFMKELNWNDYVCAGIMGNIMTEVGGQTLNLNPSSGTSYYGICQWNKNHKEVQGSSLEKQCNYLKDTIQYEFDTYGFIYKKNFSFNSFLQLTDAKQAALAFAKSYERCNSNTYEIRQNNAIEAYNYFVD